LFFYFDERAGLVDDISDFVDNDEPPIWIHYFIIRFTMFFISVSRAYVAYYLSVENVENYWYEIHW